VREPIIIAGVVRLGFAQRELLSTAAIEDTGRW
jgi:hypothetical protein